MTICCKALIDNNIESIAKEILGIYFIIIIDNINHKKYIFTDNIGFMKLFYSDKFVGDSFILLSLKEKMNINNIDKRGLIEFIRFGAVFNNRTYFKNIKILDRDKILFIDENNNFSFINKTPTDFEKNNCLSFNAFFKQYSKSIQKYNINIDITGGIDSRLLAVIFDYNKIKFCGSISTTNDSNENKIGKKVANKLKVKYLRHKHTINQLEKDLQQSFIISDGLNNTIKMTRNIQVAQMLKNENIDLSISGIGGELYKEFLYTQEYLFFYRKNINLSALYKLRFESTKANLNIFHHDYNSINKELRLLIIKDFERYKKQSKIKTIDNIWYYYKMPAFMGFHTSNIIKNYHNILLPYMELPMFFYAHNLPFTKKFFDRFHRIKTTFYNKNIAQIVTTQYISVSNEKRYLMLDVLLSILNRFMRTLRLVIRKFFGKTYFLPSRYHPDLYTRIKKLKIMKDAILYFQENNILSKNISLKNISDIHLGNILTVYLLLKYLEDNK